MARTDLFLLRIAAAARATRDHALVALLLQNEYRTPTVTLRGVRK
jgi:hypothetical protein